MNKKTKVLIGLIMTLAGLVGMVILFTPMVASAINQLPFSTGMKMLLFIPLSIISVGLGLYLMMIASKGMDKLLRTRKSHFHNEHTS